MPEDAIYEKFQTVAESIHDYGGELYLVGGAVRDIALGKIPHDADFCVTGMDVDTFVSLFPKSRVQGKDFPVFIIQGCEVALARTERKIGQKHTDFEVQTDALITIEEDLARRDFTVNAMAIHVLTHKLIDPFHGLSDLKNKVLRKTTDAFMEDPLRAYRAARFASTLGFTVEEETLRTMHEMKPDLSHLSAERVFTEFRKALVSSSPSTFFEVLKRANILDVHFPELANLIGVTQPILYHPEGDAYVHTLEVLEKASQMTPNADQDPDEELTRFCALVHDFGKALTPREEWPRHIGHEERGLEPIHDFCKRIKAPNRYEKAGKLTSLLHMKAGRFENLKPSTKVKFFDAIYQSRSISFKGMEIVARADSKDDTIAFADLANEVMSINASDEMLQKCTTEDGILDYERLKNQLLEKRVLFLKSISKKNSETPET